MNSETDDFLRDVWGTSLSDVYAVGYTIGGPGTIHHYDGIGWSLAVSTSGTSQQFISVWGTSSSDIYVTGTNGTVLHFDGTEWSAMTSGTNEHLEAVWGTSSSDVYAVGTEGTILQYDGNSWNTMTSGTTARRRRLGYVIERRVRGGIQRYDSALRRDRLERCKRRNEGRTSRSVGHVLR